jgi:hypothetical protein
MLDESEAPPIDEDARIKLRMFARQDDRISNEDFHRIHELICQFRSWTKALLEAETEFLDRQN